jgi:hypothetical protein
VAINPLFTPCKPCCTDDDDPPIRQCRSLCLSYVPNNHNCSYYGFGNCFTRSVAPITFYVCDGEPVPFQFYGKFFGVGDARNGCYGADGATIDSSGTLRVYNILSPNNILLEVDPISYVTDVSGLVSAHYRYPACSGCLGSIDLHIEDCCYYTQCCLHTEPSPRCFDVNSLSPCPQRLSLRTSEVKFTQTGPHIFTGSITDTNIAWLCSALSVTGLCDFSSILNNFNLTSTLNNKIYKYDCATNPTIVCDTTSGCPCSFGGYFTAPDDIFPCSPNIEFGCYPDFYSHPNSCIACAKSSACFNCVQNAYDNDISSPLTAEIISGILDGESIQIYRYGESTPFPMTGIDFPGAVCVWGNKSQHSSTTLPGTAGSMCCDINGDPLSYTIQYYIYIIVGASGSGTGASAGHCTVLGKITFAGDIYKYNEQSILLFAGGPGPYCCSVTYFDLIGGGGDEPPWIFTANRGNEFSAFSTAGSICDEVKNSVFIEEGFTVKVSS